MKTITLTYRTAANWNSPMATKTSTASVTEMEAKTLSVWENICGAETAEQLEYDNVSHMLLKELVELTGIDARSMRGVLSSLIQKGLIGVEEQLINIYGATRNLFYLEYGMGIALSFHLKASAAKTPQH